MAATVHNPVSGILRSGAMLALLATGAWLVGSAPVRSQAAPASAMQETLDVGDEPGRVSTEEVVITDGPFRRQLVFFRTTAAPGTIEIHTAERFLYLNLGNNRALRYVGPGQCD